MGIPIPGIFAILLFLATLTMLPAADSLQAIADRTLLRKLMDRFGIVLESGMPEEYADLFTADAEIAIEAAAPAVVKGRQELIVQVRRDHQRFGNEPAANGEPNSSVRHGPLCEAAPEWRIGRRENPIEFGDGSLGKQLGFGVG